mmetsp:Transcript_22943/g.69086  ORF Transcript_22943/g.69086 Transcript_22943/m.69086 type:complete len:211 (+) Transcript_22943:564-1196(+)
MQCFSSLTMVLATCRPCSKVRGCSTERSGSFTLTMVAPAPTLATIPSEGGSSASGKGACVVLQLRQASSSQARCRAPPSPALHTWPTCTRPLLLALLASRCRRTPVQSPPIHTICGTPSRAGPTLREVKSCTFPSATSTPTRPCAKLTKTTAARPPFEWAGTSSSCLGPVGMTCGVSHHPATATSPTAKVGGWSSLGPTTRLARTGALAE